MNPVNPVVVCGGGPVGLTLALGLAEWGVSVTVVERHRAPLPFPKGRALSIRSMEIFRQLGLEDEITDVGLPRDETMHFFNGRSLVAESYSRVSNTPPPGGSPLSPTFTLACSQDLLEAVLRRRADEHPLIDARWGVTVIDAEIADESAAVTARADDGTTERLPCRWLVAADGAHSELRSIAGIGRSRYGPECDNVNILFDADLGPLIADRSSLVYTISNEHLHAGLLTVDGRHRWLCNVIDPDVDTTRAAADPQWCTTRIHRAIGREVEVRIVAAAAWNATAANADRYRERSLLLVGDAAHVATPYGGFGMNCGIAAAHNLAWKLAAHLRHPEADDLVDTYHEERHPIGERTVRESAVRLEAALAAHRDGSTRRGEGRANPSDGLVLGGVYRSRAVFGDPEPHPDDDDISTYMPSVRPGVRAPHVWLADGSSTLDLFGAHLTVLHHPDTTPAVPTPFAGLPVRTVVLDDVADSDGSVRSTYGITDGGAVGIRPDGHIAWTE